ncbi:unnamed protein product [Phytophthora lilii]|uniref:Unnamed protein product n=1 Tax=Phytophthora lilii TaxID=2077276 RepID=A0A9W6XC60_9STRA|nr:unnamed protein product [Phytophthora lilii]
MHCNVQVNACLKLADPAANRYEVTVTRALLTHNHRVDKETFLQYSNTRLNLSDDLLGCVELMRKTGVKPKDVRSYITENSNCAPTLKDVQNILQRLRNSEDAASASAAAANGDGQEARARSHESPSDTKLSVFGATPALGPQDEVLCGYRAVASAATTNKAPEPMVPTTQFKVAHAMGKAVASLLAEIPAAEFAGAFQVLEVAASIVKKRQAEAAARAGATAATRTGSNGEDDGNETATDVDSTLHVAGASVAPVDDPWARSL